jgi:hypothetical protein
LLRHWVDGALVVPDKTVKLTGVAAKGLVGNLTSDVRSSLTGQFLAAAAMQARTAAGIEARPRSEVTEDDKVAHLCSVIGAIMQASAALECEIWEVMVYASVDV